MGEKWYEYNVLVGNLQEGDHMEDLDLDGKIIKWILKNQDKMALSVFVWVRS